MAKNIEIKARIVSDLTEFRNRVSSQATDGPIQLTQTDTFFGCRRGRLKLREFADGTSELIAYHRPDSEGPKTSDYVRSPQTSTASIKLSLERSLGIIGVVEKKREVFFIGQTRVHLDQVKNLGTFVELEVVLQESESEAEGTAIANELMKRLQIEAEHLVSGAYLDLLLSRQD